MLLAMRCFQSYDAARYMTAAILFAAFVATCVAAQTAQPVPPAAPFSTIRIMFPAEVPVDDVWLAYGLYTSGRISNYRGLDGPAAQIRNFPIIHRSGQGHLVKPKNASAFYEIEGSVDGKRVERFGAVVWARGCKAVFFDKPSITADVDEHFACIPLGEITLTGRVLGVDLPTGPTTIWASYYGVFDCFSLHTCDNGGCGGISCGGSMIFDVASGTIATDGTFALTLPNFSDDPFLSRGPVGFDLSVGEPRSQGRILLQPETAEWRTGLGFLKLAPAYPVSLIFGLNEKLH
jgi:hypothetical protein